MPIQRLHTKNEFENVAFKKAAILSRPLCVNIIETYPITFSEIMFDLHKSKLLMTQM